MKNARTRPLILTALATLGLVASTATADPAPDAVAADPDHYSVLLENEAVRVLRIRYGAGESSPVLHHHPEAVAIFLTDHEAEFEMPDGRVQTITARARDVIPTPAGAHRPTNSGDEAFELVLVELKEIDLSGGTASAGPDPTVEDPDHYSVVLENDRLRAIRIAYGPGESSVMHAHPDSVVVFLTDHTGEFELPDGTVQQIAARAGEVLAVPAVRHRPTNTGDSPFELIQVELRPGPAASR